MVLQQKDNQILEEIRVNKDLILENINMEVVQNYLKYPIDKGVYKGKKVVVKKGPHGLYAEIDDSKIKVTSEDIKLEDIIKLLNAKNSNVINERS